MEEADNKIHRACISALKSKNLEFTLDNQVILLPYALPLIDKSGKRIGTENIRLIIIPNGSRTFGSYIRVGCYFNTNPVPDDKIGAISEFIVRVNDDTIFGTLNMDFYKRGLATRIENYFGKLYNYDDVKEHFLYMIDSILHLYRECIVPLTLILNHDTDAKTAFREYEKIANYDVIESDEII